MKHAKDFGPPQEGNREPRTHFKQATNMIRFMFWKKNSSNFIVEINKKPVWCREISGKSEPEVVAASIQYSSSGKDEKWTDLRDIQIKLRRPGGGLALKEKEVKRVEDEAKVCLKQRFGYWHYLSNEKTREPGLSLDVGHAEFEGPSKQPGKLLRAQSRGLAGDLNLPVTGN